MGFAAITGADEVFVQPSAALARHRVMHSRPLVAGDTLRDWTITPTEQTVWPNDDAANPLTREDASDVIRFFWPYRSVLRDRRVFSRPIEDRGLQWWEVREVYRERFHTPLSIAFAEVATHNHFALDRGGKVFKQTAPVIKLPAAATEDDHLALLGLLNSSTACFWMKQVFYPKGGDKTGDGGRRAVEGWHDRFQHDSTKMKLFPVVATREHSLPYATALDRLAADRCANDVASLLRDLRDVRAVDLRDALDARRDADTLAFRRMVALQEELDWLNYALYGLDPDSDVVDVDELDPLDPVHLPWCLTLAAKDRASRVALAQGDTPEELPTDWFTRHGWTPITTLPADLPAATRARITARQMRAAAVPALALIETANFKRRWYKPNYAEQERVALTEWLADRVEQAAQTRIRAFSLEQLVANLQDDARVLAVSEVLTGRKDFSLVQLVAEALHADAVPSQCFHLYKPSGLVKRVVWERTWADQRREDMGEKVTPEVPPSYDSTDFLRTEHWRLRGKLDVAKERFIAFTEVPGRSGVETLYGWAGWTPHQRVKAILAIDEELEDASVPLADRIGLLDSTWRLLPDVAREDAAAAARLKAELQALVGPEGPSRELIENWKMRFPPPNMRAGGARKTSMTEVEDNDSFDDLPGAIPNVSDGAHAAILICALLHASSGTATRMDLARAFALRARPALMKKLAPVSLKREVEHWVAIVGSRSVKAGMLASTLSELASRNGVLLGTNSEGSATVSTSTQTPAEAQIDAWFRFEADLALKVLRAQPEEKFSAIDKALTGADRKLLEAAA
jgi:hypothetical protein